jgi:hypothetical protein
MRGGYSGDKIEMPEGDAAMSEMELEVVRGSGNICWDRA